MCVVLTCKGKVRKVGQANNCGQYWAFTHLIMTNGLKELVSFQNGSIFGLISTSAETGFTPANCDKV